MTQHIREILTTGRYPALSELDWSPAVHKQLIGRLHCPGQHHPVTAYFAHSPDGADPVILDTVH